MPCPYMYFVFKKNERSDKIVFYILLVTQRPSDTVANPARGQLNRKTYVLCPRSRLIVWSRETGSAGPSRASSLTHGIFLSSCEKSVHIYIIPSTATGSISSVSGHHAMAYRWPKPQSVRRHRAPVVVLVR